MKCTPHIIEYTKIRYSIREKDKMSFGTIESFSTQQNMELRSWYWYDWANQAFALSVSTILAPALISRYFDLATGGGSNVGGIVITGDSFYALVLGFSMMFVAITSPILGAIADRVPIKKKIIWVYTIIGIIFTAFMGLAPHFGEDSSFKYLAFFFVMGQIGFSGANTIYYAFMPYLADKENMDHVSSWGYAYGFIGGSLILILHLLVLSFAENSNWALSFVFVSTALWWLIFALPFFKNTPEPEIHNKVEYESIIDAVKNGFLEVKNSFKEIKKYKQLAIFLVAYLLFYDGINTIGGLAAAFAESVLRLSQQMNFVLILLVNVIAIPMSIVGGKLAMKFGTKRVLGWALGVYLFTAIVAIGFAPLELNDDYERYDFQYQYNEESGQYELDTLYDRGIKGWVSKSGEGDEKFRDAFMIFMIEGKIEGIRWQDSDIERNIISVDEGRMLVVAMENNTDHRFSFYFMGGKLNSEKSVGDNHPTIIEGGLLDFWPNFLRDNIWSPLNFGVNLQWILLGTMVGMVMGTAGAQARSLFSMLVPKTKTAEFFGFFGFMGKAAAVFGPFIYALTASSMDSRVGLMSILLVIVLGWILFPFINIEEGIRVAKQVDDGTYMSEDN